MTNVLDAIAGLFCESVFLHVPLSMAVGRVLLVGRDEVYWNIAEVYWIPCLGCEITLCLGNMTDVPHVPFNPPTP
ncbi:MAG TPA: hypothetical protein VGN88_10020, partial [Phycisphaerae bacterium]